MGIYSTCGVGKGTGLKSRRYGLEGFADELFAFEPEGFGVG
jgi:hypothetical protein